MQAHKYLAVQPQLEDMIGIYIRCETNSVSAKTQLLNTKHEFLYSGARTHTRTGAQTCYVLYIAR